MISPVSPHPVSPPGERHGGEVRLLSRLSVAFLLDLVAIVRRDLDVLDALLITTITQANVAEISRRADLQLAYADADSLPPDDLRRPVSLNALSSSLRQPYETVRRRVRGLVSKELVELGPGGATVPGRVLNSPEYLRSGLAAYEHMRRFYYQLSDLGLLGELPPRTAELPAGTLPLRALARLTSDYVLRLVDIVIAASGDILDGLVFLETFRSNVEHLPLEIWGGPDLEAREMVADDLRKPVSVEVLAERVGSPRETVRRHVRKLEAAGALERRRGGVIAPARALGRPELRDAMIQNMANLQRLFGGLSQLGVITLWDGMR